MSYEIQKKFHFIHKPFTQNYFKETLCNLFLNKEIVEKPFEQIENANQLLALRLPLEILIAEDNIINQKMIIKLLQFHGYNADVVENGKEVLEAISQKDYQIVFMDIHMPVMDGIEATKHINSNSSIEKKPIIIALTANAMVGDRETCFSAGMSDYLSKPVRLDEIKRILEFWGTIK